MERWPHGEAPEGYLSYLMGLHKQHGRRLTNVRIKPPGGIYIGKGSPWANPFRGSTTAYERVNNIYNFDMYYRNEFFKSDGPLHYTKVYDTFGYFPKPIVCYCNDGTNIANVEHLCHGLIFIASLPKAMDLTQVEELNLVFK